MKERLLQQFLEATSADDLLPHSNRTQRNIMSNDLTLLDTLHLTSTIVVCIVKDSNGNYFSLPLIQDGENLRRVIAGDGATQALLSLREINPSSRFKLKLWQSELLEGERTIGVDQTEESIIVGNRAIAKWFTSINYSANSSLARIEILQKASFSFMPAPWMSLEWKSPETETSFLISYVTEYLPNTCDGWVWATKELENYLSGNATLDSSTAFTEEIARLISEMHKTFKASTFRLSSAADVEIWMYEFSNLLTQVLNSTNGETANRLKAVESRIRTWISKIAINIFPQLTVIHGDLHVGQILRSVSGIYSIIDFDGNPVERNTTTLGLQPLVKDLAGMLQSIDHVGRIVGKRTEGQFNDEISEWIHRAQARFQNTYSLNLSNDEENPFTDTESLLVFQFQQEFKEILYAQSFLPSWMYVADAALHSLVERI